MTIAQSLLPEFEHETALTRTTLERVPEDRFGWSPHPKSFTLLALASHLATIPSYARFTFNSERLDVAPVGQPPLRPPAFKTRSEMLEAFDRGVAEARAALAEASDEALLEPWTLLSGGKTIFTLPRMAVLRVMIVNHMIHHRAQLGVYLRLCDVPVPKIYGPSADEQ
jgi:uncharacterized damage-inducible protein DinB